MRKLAILLSVLLLVPALLLVMTAPPTAADNYIQCVPGAFSVISVNTDINVGGLEILKGKFYLPYAGVGPFQFAPDSLPGILMTHGYTGSYTDLESTAAELARHCFVVLIYNYRGQGTNSDVNAYFTFFGLPERSDLDFATDHLVDGPIPGLDLVNDNTLGITGESQGGLNAWLALASPSTRARYKAVIPFDSPPLATGWLLPNNCLGAGLASRFDEGAIRTPFALSDLPNPNEPGVSWEQTPFATFSSGVLTHTPNVPALQTAVATREWADEIASVNTGTPDPNLFVELSPYDGGQPADEAIAAYQVVSPPANTAPPASTPTLAAKRLLFDRSSGHSDPPWEPNATEKAHHFRSRIGWLWDYLRPNYDPAPTPSATPPVPDPLTPTYTPTASTTPVPKGVEYVVDSYNPALGPTPLFVTQGAAQWPPVTPQPVTLYLRSGGEARQTPPGAVEGSDMIAQYYVPGNPAYNMATAVNEDPALLTWDDHIAVTAQSYTTLPLAQDVTLIGAPTAQLYVVANGDTYQVHMRVLEELGPGGARPFITRANDCAWGESAPATTATPLSFSGETRPHRFKTSDRIVFELTTIDREEYHPSHALLFIAPYLAKFNVTVWHQEGLTSSVTLPLHLANPGGPVFATLTPTPTPVGGGAPQVEPTATPTVTPTTLPAEPLKLEAFVLPGFTNPGGWHAWAPEVWLFCSGGEGAVSCPETQWLLGDGADQSFTFEARDEAGHVATVTLSGSSIDRTAPVLAESLPETQTFCSGATLPVEFNVSDALSGLASSSATFNGQPVSSGQRMPLAAGENTLKVDAVDVAGNRTLPEASVQVSYDETLLFPPDGIEIVPGVPLPFKFTISDACSANGKYGLAVGTLWLTGPDGVEIPAEWFGSATGNMFAHDNLTGWYNFDADTSELTTGTWTARPPGRRQRLHDDFCRPLRRRS